MEALLSIYLGFFRWLAKRLYGPMPETGHLDSHQQAQLREALARRHFANIAIWIAGCFGFFVLIGVGFATARVCTSVLLVILSASILAVVFLGPVVVILDYRRERRILVEELRRLAPLPICPTCGYDLRATPDRCPECGTDASRT